MTEHPISIPSPELAAKWVHEIYGNTVVIPLQKPTLQVIEHAVRWGADQELEACIAWFDRHIPGYELVADRLRAARRPKPPSLKEQALTALHAVVSGANDMREQRQDFETIRRALEQLDD
jgi:hypothetical protein